MYAANPRDRATRAYAEGAATLPPAAVLVQVHDGMVAKLLEARAAIHDDRIEDRLNASLKVAAVVEALHHALDTEQGGEIAANLGQLYAYFIRRIQALNLRNDPAICDELVARLRELREAWAAAARGDVAPAVDMSALSA
ncbi:MAG: flagellar export chaperone FliS [Pseudomonadota bacterium]